MRYLVTGANGFIGGHLLDYLVGKGDEIYGLSRKFDKTRDNVDKLSLIEGDICDKNQIDKIMKDIMPDVIFHFAAQSYPQISWRLPHETYNVNALGTLNILQSILDINPDCRIIVSSSSSVYAPNDGKAKLHESDLVNPIDHYGLSKHVMEQISLFYFQFHGLDIVIIRPFFIIGPDKEGDVCSDFSKGIVSVENKINNYLEVGNLDVFRDFLDIEDAIAAILLLCNKGIGGESYNICSGESYSLKTILEILESYSSVTSISKRKSSSKMRKVDQKYRVGSFRKLEILGWSPKIKIQISLQRIIDFWRKQSKARQAKHFIK